MIKEVPINTIDELITRLLSHENHFVYRGHANADWRLESTLERALGDRWSKTMARTVEDYYLGVFRSKYHIYNGESHQPKSKLAWLSTMQHYGAPTRLIDFTESPFVALYFAMEAYALDSDADLAVYAVDYSAIMETSLSYIRSKDGKFTETRSSIAGKQDQIFEDVVDRYSYEVVWITEPLEMNVRIDRQAGTFLIPGDKDQRIETLLAHERYASCAMMKYRVPGSLYENVYALLRKMNINAKTIYGDLGGLARSIRMDIQAHCM